MANTTISDLDTELAEGDVDGDDDFMEIDDVSAGVTKKVTPRAIVAGGVTTDSAQSIGGRENSEGTSPALARADHTHAIAPATVAVSSAHALAEDEGVLLVDTSGNRTISLPNPGLVSGLMPVLILDNNNNAEGKVITLARFGGEKIDNVAADKTLNVDGGRWFLWTNGTDWYTAQCLEPGVNGLTLPAGSDVDLALRVGGFTTGLYADGTDLVFQAESDEVARGVGGADPTLLVPRIDTEQIVCALNRVKATPQTRTLTTTLATDSELFINAVAGATYAFRAKVFVTEEGAVAGLKIAMGGTATATALRGTLHFYGDDGSLTYFAFLDAIDDVGSGVALSAGEWFVEMEGSVIVSAGGTFGVRWTPETSDGDDTTVRECSTLLVKRTG